MTRWSLASSLLLAACSQEAPAPPSSASEAPAAPPPVAAPTAPAPSPAEARSPADEAALALATEAIQTTGASLKGEVQAAMKAGGPPTAVSVCTERAPAVYAQVEADTGVRVGRASLRMRNTSQPVPPWVQEWLTATGERKVEGVEGVRQVVDTDDGRVARALEPIGIAPMCLTCHGQADALDPSVRALLGEHYPEDRATGYEPGDLRGVMWAEAPVGT